jgi:ribosomal protein S11
MATGRSTKKIKKDISDGIAHISASFNNTIIAFAVLGRARRSPLR